MKYLVWFEDDGLDAVDIVEADDAAAAVCAFMSRYPNACDGNVLVQEYAPTHWSVVTEREERYDANTRKSTTTRSFHVESLEAF